MSKAWNPDRALEAALASEELLDADSRVMVELVQGLRGEVAAMAVSSEADAHILAAAAAVPQTSSVVSPRPPVSARRLKARLAVVMASMMALLLATAGVGLAADGAAPGDALYGLDRALERVGINNGRAQERLTEAVALAEAGEIARGLDHAATAMATLPEQAQGAAAQAALSDAAARLAEDGNAPTGVGDLLRHLASVVGTGDGQSVAEIAHQIRDTVERGRRDGAGGPPEHAPGPPEGVPGRGPGG